MALDKLVDSSQLDTDLTSVANAIRTKGGTSASLAFPADFISAIEAISGGGGGLEYDAGTFTLASDRGGGAATYNVPHNLGEVPGMTLVWTNYFDDEDHTPDKNTCIGFLFLQGLMSLPQRLSSSATATGFYANLAMYSGERTIQFSAPSSTSYAAYSSTAENIRLNGKPHGSNYYWIGGITYNYIVIKKWW